VEGKYQVEIIRLLPLNSFTNIKKQKRNFMEKVYDDADYNKQIVVFVDKKKSGKQDRESIRKEIEAKFNAVIDDSDDPVPPIENALPDIDILRLKTKKFGEIKANAVNTISQGEIAAEIIKNLKIKIPDITQNLNLNKQNGTTFYISGEYQEKIKTCENNKKVIIAVLDTGVRVSETENEEGTIPKELIWNLQHQSSDYNQTATKPENNQINRDGIEDNSIDLHGTIVSLFILNEFIDSKNTVELMILKTHNRQGEGNFYDTLNAIAYAVENGADIINASWGSHEIGLLMPKLKSLIAERLNKAGKRRNKNVIFVTAAGNKLKETEDEFKKFLKSNPEAIQDTLRDLNVFNVYPACLSFCNDKIITVASSDHKKVSNDQNYSNLFVDIGVLADQVTTEDGIMRYRIPFEKKASGFPVTGSSFATAIVSGIIGAHWDKKWDEQETTKFQIFKELPSIIKKSGKGLAKQISDGRFTKSQSRKSKQKVNPEVVGKKQGSYFS
jgi:hypothetical protein